MTKNKNQKTKSKRGKSQKKKYRIRNWPEYNEMLKKRGEIDVWVEERALKNWYAKPRGKPGAQPIYSDLAIQITRQFGLVFRQRLRQTEGLVTSVFRLMTLDLKVPDYSTLCRRSELPKVRLPGEENKQDGLVLVADSSGLKVYGEGEWKVRKYGFSARRTWRKMHLVITPDGEIRAADLTPNSVADEEVIPGLLNQEKAGIESFTGDGGYDKRRVYQTCRQKQVRQVIVPPQKNAKIWKHGNAKGPSYPRDEHIRYIRKTSRSRWKQVTGYHRRSLAETAVFRFKTIFGDKLKARKFSRQRTEFLIAAAALNKMTRLGMPESYAVT